jgi:hypothetical protein
MASGGAWRRALTSSRTFSSACLSGYSLLPAKQDLWAVAILFICNIVIAAAEPELKKRCSNEKTPYQINRNVGP